VVGQISDIRLQNGQRRILLIASVIIIIIIGIAIAIVIMKMMPNAKKLNNSTAAPAAIWKTLMMGRMSAITLAGSFPRNSLLFFFLYFIFRLCSFFFVFFFFFFVQRVRSR
jgi:di/tricarboxylate transporter